MTRRGHGRGTGLMLAVTALAGMAAGACAPVTGQPEPALAACEAPERMRALLTTGAGARLAASGVTGTGALLNIHVKPDGRWFLTHVQPGGQACLLTVGEGWESGLATPPAAPAAVRHPAAARQPSASPRQAHGATRQTAAGGSALPFVNTGIV